MGKDLRELLNQELKIDKKISFLSLGEEKTMYFNDNFTSIEIGSDTIEITFPKRRVMSKKLLKLLLKEMEGHNEKTR